MEESKKSLTQAALKEQLHYEPTTGLFTWLKSGTGRKVGGIAGCKDHGYIRIMVCRKLYRAHHLAWLYMTGNWPTQFIDHINRIKDCNIWTNLRECTKSQNQFNTGAQRNNTSGYKGVYWNKRDKKWRAQASLQGKIRCLGLFNSAESASDAYQAFAKLHHGEFFKDIQ